MAIAHGNGAPTWFELATRDQAVADRFYAGLFGWTWRTAPMPDGSHYTIFQLGGRDVAACYTLMADQAAIGIPPHWSVYFRVADCDAAADAVRTHGGTVHCEPYEVMEHLRSAVVADPEGAVFALHQPRAHAGVGVLGEPGSVLWVELATRDLARAEAFYSAVLGWGATPFDAGPMTYRVLSAPGAVGDFGGMVQMDEQWEGVPSHWSLYLHVTDVDATVARAVELGGSCCVAAFDVPRVGRIARLDDPSGAGFYVMAPNPQG
jgi:predicted enzyme related to lactoylglutathione lyase